MGQKRDGSTGRSTPRIEIRNLYKVFGKRPEEALQKLRAGHSKQEILDRSGHTVGLDDVSLEVRPGETFVVMGLSGSGKSTLIRCINRLIEPTAGEIRIDGQEITGLSAREMQHLRRRKMGMVFQRFALLPHRSVLDNVSYGLKLQGMGREARNERARRWIEVVGLGGYESARPRALSGGMQQRVGLARALATDPEILLMDEAFSALDPLIRREMQDELIRLQKDLNKTIVFITHDLDEALRLGDRVAILKAGRVVQVGTPQDILTAPADEYVSAFVRHVDRSRVLTARAALEEAFEVPLGSSPASVLPQMAGRDREVAFVVDNRGRYRGVVGIDDVRMGARRGDTNLRSLLTETAPTIHASAPLLEAFSAGAASRVPIAVVGDNDAFEGVLTHRGILGVLSGQDSHLPPPDGSSEEIEGARAQDVDD